ncbi:MAG: GNAT family N-acetyltransferase [Gammaproteobacteria bacterium]|nr:GNAT family N-acetyltransferase [Gammaproteobacteria bacterium]
MTPLIRAATASDFDALRALLEAAGLPTADLRTSRPAFLVAAAGRELVGAGALEIHADTALLRSLAVAPAWRGRGLGHQVVKALERQARAAGLHQIVLLTETAEAFFTRLDYRVIDRAQAPPAVQASREFAALCPASAVCLAKTLR